MEQKVKIKEKPTAIKKNIITRTKKEYFCPITSNYNPNPKTRLKSIVSEIEFSVPIEDGNAQQGSKRYHKNLKLETVILGDYKKTKWLHILRGIWGTIAFKEFDKLPKPFDAYLDLNLKDWQNQATKIHDSTLKKLETLYLQKRKRTISGYFFNQ